jgi:hypothetical protein
VNRAALDAVNRAFLGVAVLFEAALQQDDDARFTAGGRSEQQKQASADFRAGARRPKVVGEPLELVVDAEKIFRKEFLTRGAVGSLFNALPADHVPDVLVAAASDRARIARQHLLDEFSKSSGPVCRPMLLGEGYKTLNEVAMALSLVSPVRHATPPGKVPSPAVFKRRTRFGFARS